ncbi:MFS transporter [Dyadobacter sp. 3J3]|uniref:MFS transporter n=1 Tax=Dyadobacter sp. 3J3 TaxID=2606600 RepID=UPI00135C922B|nr:MFS transporter [Dyadobacter sp. 3J3]
MSNHASLFKSWVPEWLVKVGIGMVLFPLLTLFGLFTSNVSATAGYYGIEPIDVQYSTIVYYAALVGWYSLEQRFFNNLAAKQYFTINVILLLLTCYVSYFTHSSFVFFLTRFLQGIFTGGINSICLTLIFRKLSSERSREIGYSVFYGMLVCSSPLVMLLASLIIEYSNYQSLYQALIFMILPGCILLMCMMKNVRLARKFPLYQLDWSSFVYYMLILCLFGYILIYGQKNYWLESLHIWVCIGAILLLLPLFIFRQLSLKRPFINLAVFKYSNFRIGAALLIPFYICRGSLNITSNYFDVVLGMDPIHVSELMLANMIGVIVSVFISSRLILMKKPMRMIWLGGFAFLLLFHGWMYFLFATQADASTFILPLIVQGLGAGTLMAPIILFTVSSVPAAIGASASMAGILFRFIGFTMSMAMITSFQLFAKSTHKEDFRNQITALSPVVQERLKGYVLAMESHGVAKDQAMKIANVLLSKAVDKQMMLRYAMDYYSIICWVIVGVMLLISLYPYFSQTVLNVRSRQPAPY